MRASNSPPAHWHSRYLTLVQLQPPILPRPDLTSLGVRYRRIPVLSIGRDIYLDSRLIVDKLSAIRPSSPATPEQRAIERLLRTWTTSTELFTAASMLLPLDNPMMNDPVFLRDRADLLGGKDRLSRETRAAARPQAIITMRALLEFLETTLLGEGRTWVLGSEGPSAADVEAVWLLRWVTASPGGLDGTGIDQTSFPKVFAWIDRFGEAVKAARKSPSGKPLTISGEQAAAMIVGAPYNDAEGEVDESDPVAQALGLRKGQLVQLCPSDYGSTHKDEGKLVSLSSSEITIETVTAGGATVRLHAPRQGFRVAPVKAQTKI